MASCETRKGFIVFQAPPECTNAGDLLSALLLARLDETPDDLKQAVELAIGSLQGIVQKTYETSVRHLGRDEPTPQVCRSSHCSATAEVHGEGPLTCAFE